MSNLMTSEVILHFIKNLCYHDVSIHRIFYKNKLINEYARKNVATISEYRNHGARSFC